MLEVFHQKYAFPEASTVRAVNRVKALHFPAEFFVATQIWTDWPTRAEPAENFQVTYWPGLATFVATVKGPTLVAPSAVPEVVTAAAAGAVPMLALMTVEWKSICVPPPSVWPRAAPPCRCC